MSFHPTGRRVAGVGIAFIFALGACAYARAANNPLDTIRAEKFSAKSPGIKTESCAEGGQHAAAIHDGDFLKYSAFDFDSGVAAFKARIAGPRSGTIEIHLDSSTGVLMGKCDEIGMMRVRNFLKSQGKATQ